ncbi:MAG: histidinol-phosphatase HisJ family protein [Clostridia bacterium]|nr:histidinol-phosphatase HisJ family protein [Clostridia bacterium]
MSYLQNLHQHTTYCDGRDTPEDVVLAAIERGFDSIGISSHSYMYYSAYGKMTPENNEGCKREVRRLQAKYADKIDLFCGFEFDMFSIVDMAGYDYMIGSVHYLDINGEKVGFDRSAEEVRAVIDTYFGGNGMAYARAYYKTLAHLPEYGSFDIIGHFDLITKHSETHNFFDTSAPEYRRAAVEAAEALSGKIPYFEINTGAIARGYRTTPYPDPYITKEMKRLDFGAIISSDCHDVRYLDTGYDMAKQLLRDAGFDCHYVLTKNGFIPIEL